MPSDYLYHKRLSLTSITEGLTPQSQSPILPIEVWERAIDWLVVGHTRITGTPVGDLGLRRDLSNCVLVCHAWRARAQFYLFVHLRIVGNGLSQYGSLISRSPTICDLTKVFLFYNQYVQEDKTIETASHAVRIAHKLSNAHYLLMDRINLAIEHPHLARHTANLKNINTLHFLTRTPTKLSHLARILVGLQSLSTLTLDVPIVMDPNSLPLPTPCFSTKSSLTELHLRILSGGHLLVDWLVKAKSFTSTLQILDVRLKDQMIRSEIPLVVKAVQYLLENCAGSLKRWYFWALPNGSPSFPQGNVS